MCSLPLYLVKHGYDYLAVCSVGKEGPLNTGRIYLSRLSVVSSSVVLSLVFVTIGIHTSSDDNIHFASRTRKVKLANNDSGV